MERKCLKIIQYATYLILFTPLIFSSKFFFPFVTSKSIYFFALSEIIFFSYLILVLNFPKYRPRLNPILLVLTIFLVILILSSVFGVDFQNSFWSKYERMTGLLMWFHLFAFFIVLTSVFKREEEWQKIFGVSVFVAVVISLMSISEKIGITIIGASSRGGATLGNSSFLGTYLLFNFFLALYLFLKTNPEIFRSTFNKIFNFYSLLGMGLIGLSLWFSTAKAALLSTLGGLVLLFLLWLVFCKKGKLKIIAVFLLAVLLFSVIAFGLFTLRPESYVYKMTIEKYLGKTFGGRFVVWQAGWKGFLEKPLLGWGPDNFAIIFCKYFNPIFFTPEGGLDIWYDQAHNIVFDTLGTSGILGFLGYLSIFGASFYVLWKKFFEKKIKFEVAGIFSVILISYFVQNLTVFDMVSSYLMLFLVLGFVASLDLKPRESVEYKKSKLKILLTTTILVSFIFSFVIFVIQPLRASSYVIEAVRAQPFSEKKLGLYKKALNTSVIGRDQIREFFADSTISFSRSENIEKVPEGNIEQELDFICQELEKGIKRNPLNFRANLKLGKVYNTYFLFDESKYSDAQRVLERAIELSPQNQQGYWQLAQTKLYRRKVDEALALAETAVALEPKAEKSHLVLIQIAKLTGDRDLLMEKIEDALKINTEWATGIKDVLGLD